MTQGTRRGFVTGGTWCVDNNRIVSYWPEEDGLVEVLSEQKANGGSGSNFALGIRQLDTSMPVETITIIGDDEDGRLLMRVADKAGVGRKQMHISPEAPTQAAEAFVSQKTHRRTHMFVRGVASLLTPDHFDFTQVNARYLHLGLPGVHLKMDSPWQGDANGWVTVLKKARASGLSCNMELASINPGLMLDLVGPCLPHLSSIIVNDVEIGALSGEQTIKNGVTDVAACQRAARIVLNKGVSDLVVIHSPMVAVAATRKGELVVKPSVNMPQSEVVSANGAGDAFAVGMMYGVHEGWSIEKSLELAHASAACSLRSLATSGAIEPWEETLRLASRWGWRSL